MGPEREEPVGILRDVARDGVGRVGDRAAGDAFEELVGDVAVEGEPGPDVREARERAVRREGHPEFSGEVPAAAVQMDGALGAAEAEEEGAFLPRPVQDGTDDGVRFDDAGTDVAIPGVVVEEVAVGGARRVHFGAKDVDLPVCFVGEERPEPDGGAVAEAFAATEQEEAVAPVSGFEAPGAPEGEEPGAGRVAVFRADKRSEPVCEGIFLCAPAPPERGEEPALMRGFAPVPEREEPGLLRAPPAESEEGAAAGAVPPGEERRDGAPAGALRVEERAEGVVRGVAVVEREEPVAVAVAVPAREAEEGAAAPVGLPPREQRRDRAPVPALRVREREEEVLRLVAEVERREPVGFGLEAGETAE